MSHKRQPKTEVIRRDHRPPVQGAPLRRTNHGSLQIHEDHINARYSPKRAREHFNSYDYCMAKLIHCGWDITRCPREWAIVSEHERRLRDERWRLALNHARGLFDQRVAEDHPLRQDPHKASLAILRKAERILCEQMYVPPTFHQSLECHECGTVPAPPHSKGCPWCRTSWRQHQIAQVGDDARCG